MLGLAVKVFLKVVIQGTSFFVLNYQYKPFLNYFFKNFPGSRDFPGNFLKNPAQPGKKFCTGIENPNTRPTAQ